MRTGVNNVTGSNMVPWFSWESTSSSGGEGGPSHEWLRLFWKCFGASSGDLSLFSDWPLIPAFLGRPILCRVKERHLVFVLPLNKHHLEMVLWMQSVLGRSGCFQALVAAKHDGYFPELASFSASDSDELVTFFAQDFLYNGSTYRAEELEPSDERCLSYSTDSIEFSFLRALGVPELHDQQILMRFGLPDFEDKPQSEQEDILIYLYTYWQDLQADSSLLEVLKETKKFPGERFSTDGWLLILRKTGLQTAAEADVILECAKRVEFLGSECYENTSGDFDGFWDQCDWKEMEVEDTLAHWPTSSGMMAVDEDYCVKVPELYLDKVWSSLFFLDRRKLAVEMAFLPAD
ncbi:hypothetical protein NC653_013707 [Populus alba x Populus x berolinensis]|uniref:Uncharacterized protein n=1 Tax=Populus alba x Populus x berolinensis TaxID=444605 RepID=A0AAD6W3C7_9ROSI|nr:hypothetical protein NC653_013707 [Populus alba x Populus x berolinensis]